MNHNILLTAVVIGLGLLSSLQTARTLNPGKAEKGGDYLPTKLRLSSSNFRAHHTLIVWDGKVLQFEKSGWGKATQKETITPSEESWKKFWKEMDMVGIWKWDEEYIDKNLADGDSWDVLLEYGDKKVHSRGRNRYPAQFERYEKAVLELLEAKAK
jgi:hypothetical protein